VNLTSPKRWEEVSFGEVVVHSAFGPRFSGDAYSADGNVATLRTTDLDDQGRIAYESMPLARLDEDRFAHHLLTPGDLVITRSGTCGIAAVFDTFALPVLPGAFLIRFRLNGRAEPRFFRYYFNSPTGRMNILSVARGAVQQNLNITSIETLKVPLPPLQEQRRIVASLSAYDDLIENNRRRMALLEEAARLLYREWFVRLRFPGHEHTRVFHGIPEEWEAYTLDDLCSIGRGASPRPIADFMDGDIPWFKIGDATSSESSFIFETQEHVTEDGARKSVNLEPGALILSNSATCGLPYFSAVRGCVHDGWLHFSNFKRISQQFLYCFLYCKREELVSSVGDGSTQKNLNTAAVGRLKVTIPPNETLLVQFEGAIQPIFSQLLNLARQNVSLRAARDLLLPGLMRGEIAV
jgi:type I restriction enzyme S subunit